MDTNLPPMKRFPEAHKLPKAVKAELVSKIRASLANPAAVERAVTILFNRQVKAERDSESTMLDNSLGVTAYHGRQVAYFGKWIRSGKHLTGYHLDKARKLCHRYAATQLFEIAALKAGLIRDADEDA